MYGIASDFFKNLVKTNIKSPQFELLTSVYLLSTNNRNRHRMHLAAVKKNKS
jgi:hypothetical protein